MRVFKVINNNVIVAIRDGEEVVVFGSGIGFNARRGSPVDLSKVSKMFVSADKRSLSVNAVAKMDFKILEIANDIIDYGSKRFGLNLKDNTFFSLCDHLDMAVERLQEGVAISNPFSYDVKTYFPAEYQTARLAVHKISDAYGIEIDDDEVCFIALHLIEGGDLITYERTAKVVVLIDGIMQIVRRERDITEEMEQTYQYNRLLTHVKFFANRFLEGDAGSSLAKSFNDSLYQFMVENFPKESDCVENVSQMLEEKYGRALEKIDKVYLIMHLKCLGT